MQEKNGSKREKVKVALETSTIDCTLVSDSDLEEMSMMCSELVQPFSVGFLSKEAESWVQVTTVSERNTLKGFSFYTLERLGGTPCIVIGATSVLKISKRSTMLKSMIKEQLKKAIMTFPDEDVLIGARFLSFAGLELFAGLTDLIPQPGHQSNGEEIAWGKRLATKYGIGTKVYDSATLVVKGNGETSSVVDYETLHPEKLDKNMKKLFSKLDTKRRDSIIIYGWAKSKYLAKHAGK